MATRKKKTPTPSPTSTAPARRGRPPGSGSNPDVVRMLTRVPADLFARVEAAAAESRRSRDAFVLVALEQALTTPARRTADA